MADLTLRGMVIRTVDYRDNDRILTLFTAESGRVDAKARNCRKATSPLLACTQPFTYGEYQLFYSKNKYIIDQGEVLESFYPLREDVEKYAAASLCASMCLEGVQAEESSEDIFSLPLKIKKLLPCHNIFLRKHPYVPAWDINLYVTK